MEQPNDSDGGADTGGRVDRTGIVLVHEGEYIGPDPSSAAEVRPAGPQGDRGGELSPTTIDDAGEVHYWFPIQIEVVGEVDQELVDQVVARVFDELQQELASRG